MLVPRPHFFAHLVWAPGRLRRLFPSNLDDHQLSSPLSSLIFSFCRLCSWCCVLCLLRGHVACDIECPLSTFHSVCWIRTLARYVRDDCQSSSKVSHAPREIDLFTPQHHSLSLIFSISLSCPESFLSDPDCLGFGCALVVKNNFASKGAWPN